MTRLLTTTAFGLIRRLAMAGTGTQSLYLLIADEAVMEELRADIEAESQVQLGYGVRVLTASELQAEGFERVFLSDEPAPVTLVVMDRWARKLVTMLDRNVILLARGSAVLLLVSPKVAECAVASAPNLRNRLTDMLEMKIDDALGGPGA